jgi:hypothetical protein
MRVRGLLAGGLALGSAAVAAQGAVVARDSYESPGYSTGTLFSGPEVTGQQPVTNGGTGFSSQLVDAARKDGVTVDPFSLSYIAGELTINGGAQSLLLGGITDSNNVLSRGFATQSDTLYVSLMVRLTANTQGPATTDEDFLQIGLSDVTAGEPKASFGTAGTAQNVVPSKFYARVPNGGTSQFGGTQITATGDETFFVVARFSKVSASTNYNQVDLYVNPTTLAEPGTASMTANQTGAIGSVSNLIIRRARSDAADGIYIDNIIIGTTYSDVVPEPGAIGLSVLGAGLLALRRRRHGIR